MDNDSSCGQSRPQISMIVAMGNDRVVGMNNKLPWGKPIRADMEHFRQHTLHKAVVMGRSTWQSLSHRPLPERINIVLSRDIAFCEPGCLIARDVGTVLDLARSQETVVIGGPLVYTEFLQHTDRLFVTQVEHSFPGDAYFPEIDDNEWEVVSIRNMEPGDSTPFPLTFLVYERKRQEVFFS